jgi:PAS domain S-box-containing protein
VSERPRARLGVLALRPYGGALIAIALAILVRRLGDPRLGTEQLPYGSMLVAAMIVVWLAGLRPALVVVYLGGVAANFFLLAPRMSFAPGPAHQGWGLLVFLILGTVIAMFGGFTHLQRARAEAAAETIRSTEAALRDAHDGLEHRVRDRIAELARINESLRASEERFRLLVEGIRGYAIFMFDATGAIAGWNRGAERLFERSADVVGDRIAALIPGLQGAALVDAIRRGTGELHAVRPGGAGFPIELAITRLEPSGLLVGIVHDISERKQLEAEAERKQRRADELRRKTCELEADNRRMQESARVQGQFLANMSHELRTPLNAIIGFSEMMHCGAAGPIEGQHREFLGDILSSSRRLLQLINNVLDLAKAESATLEVAPQPVELAGVIDEVGDLMRDMAAGRRIAIELDLATNLGSVTVDLAKLRQILYNYVSNALKFTPEGGRVTIRATPIDDGFRVEVEDTGIGIASEELRYLFVAFRQLDASATKRYPGTGLGLALTKRLAEAHGGTVGVRSVRGVGSTFWVELPRQTVPGPGLRVATPPPGTIKALG